MRIGASQIDITPRPGVEMSGFAARIQPSTGVLDPLFAKALYLEADGERLLWIHADLVGFDREIVLSFRRWAKGQFGLDKVMLSATHTHSGPCTIHLFEAGDYDPSYVKWLQCRLQELTQTTLANTESAAPVAVEGHLDLAVDRRKKATPHTDPRVAALGFKRPDGTFAAVIANYAMHAVALGASNRCLSSDIPGQAALSLSRSLPGNPIAMITNGACGNLNPPAENVPFQQIQTWGKAVADAVVERLLSAPPLEGKLRVSVAVIDMPLDILSLQGIEAFAQKSLQDAKSLAEWGDKYRRAVAKWKEKLTKATLENQAKDHAEAEIFVVQLGAVHWAGLNAEVFSLFTDWLREATGKTVYLIGYANGEMGYLPTRAAYREGGYEVDVAHLFYGSFRPKAGSLELLSEKAAELIRSISA